MILIASRAELDLVEDTNEPIIITGEGAEGIIRALRDIPRETPIKNIGYAGSNLIRVGTKCRVSRAQFYYHKADIESTEYILDGEYPCYTAGDFVTSTNIKEPCLFDMELAYILALGFENVVAEKTVSDNLNIKEYQKCMRK